MRRMASIHHMSRSLCKDIMSDLKHIFKKQFKMDFNRICLMGIDEDERKEKQNQNSIVFKEVQGILPSECRSKFVVEALDYEGKPTIEPLFFRFVLPLRRNEYNDVFIWSSLDADADYSWHDVLSSFIDVYMQCIDGLKRLLPSAVMVKLCCGWVDSEHHFAKQIFPLATCGDIDDDIISSIVKFKLGEVI